MTASISPLAPSGGGVAILASPPPPATTVSATPETLLKRGAVTALARPGRHQKLDEIKGWQRDVMDARLCILQYAASLVSSHGFGVKAAFKETERQARGGELPPHIQAMISKANARRGRNGSRTISSRSLESWHAQKARGGNVAVAPKPVDRFRVPSWLGPLMECYRIPQKPSLQAALRKLRKTAPAGVKIPTYKEANYFLKKYVSKIELNRGRIGTRELRGLMAFFHRDTSNIPPFTVYMADGTTFKAEVAHPLTGKPFKPEITSIIDVKTKFLCGFSADLAESGLAVLTALSRAIEACGFPAIFCADNGSGYANAMMENAVCGFLSRFSITPWHSFPYNSQEQGAIERSHRTIWIEAAKTLASYVGKDMDKQAAQRFFKVSRKQIEESGFSSLLPAWEDFVALLWARRYEYNNSPHRALPKIVDPEAGEIRHQTPAEAAAQAVEEGWEQFLPAPEESAQLYRPQKECKVIRGEIRFGNKSYFHPDLEEHGGQKVLVGYDAYNPALVWVYTLEQVFICTAELDANRRDFVPLSEMERALEDRVKGRLRRNEIKGQRIREELQGFVPTEAVETTTPAPALSPERKAIALRTFEELSGNGAASTPPPAENGRPCFANDKDWARWVMANPEKATEEDTERLRRRLESFDFRLMLGIKSHDVDYQLPGLVPEL